MSKNAGEGQAQQSATGAIAAHTPDGQVARRIVAQLVADGLIDTAQADGVWAGLTGGAARSADWRFIAELAIARGVCHAADAR